MPKAKRQPLIPEIPLETWRALYEAADALGELRLWECMGDSELLGVDDPHTDEPVLGAVMGTLGEVFGLALHHGPAALRWVLELATSDEPDVDMDTFLSIAVVKVEFVPKRELPPEDKQRMKALGFTPRGGARAKWPAFQSHRPGYLPWHIDETDARRLLHTLPRLTALGAAVRPLYESDDAFPTDGFAFFPKGRAPGPLRLEEVEWRQVGMPPESAPASFAVDEVTAAILAKLPQQPSMVLEVEAFCGGGVVADGGENGRPWLVKAALAAEAESGFIAALEMGNAPGDALEAIASRALVGGMKALGVRPGAVHLKSPRAAESLTALAAQLGFTLKLCRALPAVDEARASMPPQFGFGQPR